MASCLGGGDLDGDIYNLLPLGKMPEFRPRSVYEPASYEPAPKKLLDRPSNMKDVADFVVEFISSDVSPLRIFMATTETSTRLWASLPSAGYTSLIKAPITYSMRNVYC